MCFEQEKKCYAASIGEIPKAILDTLMNGGMLSEQDKELFDTIKKTLPVLDQKDSCAYAFDKKMYDVFGRVCI